MNFKCNTYVRFIKSHLRLMSVYKTKNHYDSLGISSTSTQGEVKSAYYKLSMLYHPDKNQGDAVSAEKFRDITEAYEVLGNVKTRKLYDKGGFSFRTAAVVPDTEDRFHKSRETRSRPPPPTGRTPVYDFDEWSKNHYGSTFKRQMDNKRREEIYRMRRQEEKHDMKTEKMLFIFLTIALLYTSLNYSRNYDNVKYSSDRSNLTPK